MDFSEFINLIPDQLMWLINSFLGGILGLLIGLERSKRLKEAGMGTHFIVGFASALLTCISLSFKTGEYGDGARIAAQIISGIGFLGAGMIFFRRETLHGLTTAAGVWATSAIGMCAGRGMYILAVGATVIVLIVQSILHTKSIRQVNRQRLLLLKFVDDGVVSDQIRTYFGVEQFYRYKVSRKEEGLHVEAVVRPIKNYHAEELNQLLLEHPNVLSIERLEDL
ncbi:MAG: MgtC/SapB family protein [Clostridia bacterium]|nr:MgtC/SapB family protein [Clostridia bacterium]